MAIPLRPNDVPKELICTICLSVPLEPIVMTKCNHVFCKDCITESIYRQECAGRDQTCPVCRSDCIDDDLVLLKEESPLSYRIWSNIQVKCEHHTAGCNWIGSISDYRNHKCSCEKANKQRKRDKELICSLRKQNSLLKAKNEALLVMNKDLERKYRRHCLTTVSKELDNLRMIIMKDIQLPIGNGKGGYAYDRTSVVELSQLICQNLEDKPSSINPNKIFECVRNIARDLQRQREDNPKHFYMDVRMLLGICLASTWFTENQLARIEEMAASCVWG